MMLRREEQAPPLPSFRRFNSFPYVFLFFIVKQNIPMQNASGCFFVRRSRLFCFFLAESFPRGKLIGLDRQAMIVFLIKEIGFSSSDRYPAMMASFQSAFA